MTVRWGVLEAVTAGLCGPSPEPSLLAEGRAMLSAVTADLSAIDGNIVQTVVDGRLPCFGPLSPALSPENGGEGTGRERWRRLCADSDAVIIIAPETDGLLAELVDAAGRQPHLRVWNATAEAIRLATDKLLFSRHLERHGVPTIPTSLETWTDPPDAFPCVIKPRDGAGSWLVRRVDDVTMWQQVRTEYKATTSSISGPLTPVIGGEGWSEGAGNHRPALRQPYLRGRHLSLAGWFRDDGVDWLPIAEQRLSDDGQLRYLGGRIPAAIPDVAADVIRALGQAASVTVPGLRGFIGFDVLLPDDAPREPLLVELNPRFTTSYVGYRAWSDQNLLKHWLALVGWAVPTGREPPRGMPHRCSRVGTAHPTKEVVFDADGTVRRIPAT